MDVKISSDVKPHVEQESAQSRRATGNDLLLALLSALYEAAAGDDSWERCMPMLAEYCGAPEVDLQLFEGKWSRARRFSMANGSILTSGVSAGLGDRFVDRVSGTDHLEGQASKWLHRLSPSGWMYRIRVASGNASDPGYAEPPGPSRYMTLEVTSDRTASVSLMLFRPAAAGPFSPESRERIDGLAEHLFEAGRLLEMRRKKEAQREISSSLMDRMSAGMLILDGEGTVLTSNESARRMARTGDGFAIIDSKLRIAEPTARRRIEKMLAASTDVGTQTGFDSLVTIRRVSDQPPYVGRLLRIEGESTRHRCPVPERTFLLSMADPEQEVTAVCELLGELYALTPAESRVLQAALWQPSQVEMAKRLGSSVHTVRMHMKSIFRKTATKRHAELVRKVLLAVGSLV